MPSGEEGGADGAGRGESAYQKLSGKRETSGASEKPEMRTISEGRGVRQGALGEELRRKEDWKVAGWLQSWAEGRWLWGWGCRGQQWLLGGAESSWVG